MFLTYVWLCIVEVLSYIWMASLAISGVLTAFACGITKLAGGNWFLAGEYSLFGCACLFLVAVVLLTIFKYSQPMG